MTYLLRLDLGPVRAANINGFQNTAQLVSFIAMHSVIGKIVVQDDS